MESPAPRVPIRPDLWELVLPAVRACKKAVERNISQRQAANWYVPTIDVKYLVLTPDNWPAIPFPIHKETRKHIDLTGVISSSNRDNNLPYASIPELQRVITFVRSDARLAGFGVLGLPNDYLPPEMKESMAIFSAAQWVLKVLARANAINVDSDLEILQIYCDLETALLAEALPFQAVIPLLLTDFEIEERLDLDKSVWIERMTDETQHARFPGPHPSPVPDGLLAASTHALVLDGLSMSNAYYHERLNGVAPSQVPLEVADRACEAISVVTGATVGYSQVLCRPVDWADRWSYNLPPLHELGRVRNYPLSLDQFSWHRPRVTTSIDSSRLPQVFKALTTTSTAKAKLATNRLRLAGMRDQGEDAILDACIGLEALIGSESGELSWRMTLRTIYVLSHRPNVDIIAPATIRKWIGDIYRHRSAVAHGAISSATKLDFAGYEVSTTWVALFLLRALLLDYLTSKPHWTPASIDENILASLVPQIDKC